jgi:DNA sulfur modification protein DndD
MIIDRLTLHDFGVYAGRQTVELTPPSAQKPVILLGGLNGGGKTSFIDAIQLCMYGSHAKLSNRGTLGYAEYLDRSIHRGNGAEEASVELVFRHTVEGKEDEYLLIRSWKRQGATCKERFEVVKNGRTEPALTDNWASQVDDFMPSQIAHLFLFDGEQIESYASDENSSALIGSAIQSLLGLDMVDQLEKDLFVYEKRKKTESKEESLRDEIAKAEATLEGLRTQSTALSQKRASIRTHQLDRKERALKELEARYRKIGGPLFEQKSSLEAALTAAQETVRLGVDLLREQTAGSLPLLLVTDLLESANVRDRKEREIRTARDLNSIVKKRDESLLKYLKSNCKDGTAVRALRQFLEEDRDERARRGKMGTVLDIGSDARGDIQFLVRGGLDAIKKDASALVAKVIEDRAREARLEQETQSIPAKDTIAEIVKERDALKKEIAGMEAEYSSVGHETDRIGRDLVRTQQHLARLLESDAKVESGRQDRERILRHSEKVRSILPSFRRAVVERHLRRIEELIYESYSQLFRKSSLISKLSIDPETYRLTLYGKGGDVVSTERLSAGERQLLAIAVLWGLAKSSGRPLPTAIDTPLGRLDMSHRTHLVERYFPQASHQVFLLSTDEEISGQYLRMIRPAVGRAYQLVYDDATGGTRIVPGYFEEREAA